MNKLKYLIFKKQFHPFLYLKWIISGKPMIVYSGFNCGCCGRWHNIKIEIPKYKSCGEWWDTWGVCPNKKGCMV